MSKNKNKKKKAKAEAVPEAFALGSVPASDGRGRLAALDLTLAFSSKQEYESRLKQAQLDLLTLEREITEKKVPVLIVMEGCDAAGKGGAIKRLTGSLDPRGYNVVSIGAPTPAELAHHYLWRFWTQLPPRGRMVVFDRSWYGRVLVERVEKLCSEADWRRAYGEINAFEQMLAADGAVICKFWLQISKKEQLHRFKEREQNPFKNWKLTPEDWRNRKKWDRYQAAAEEMFDQTSAPCAPWTLVESEYKWYSRVKVLETVVQAIREKLK